MNISPESVTIDNDYLRVDLNDGRTLGVPLAWFPRLLNASPEDLRDYELTAKDIHWDKLNEDISIQGLLAGQGDLTRPYKEVA